MMTLIAFLVMAGVITLVARYNEDDSLFWKLIVSLVGAYGAATVISNVMNSDEKDKVVMINDNPTQVHKSENCAPFVMCSTSLVATRREKSQKPVSKDTVIKSNDSILSEVFVSARGQPQISSVRRILHELVYFDTS